MKAKEEWAATMKQKQWDIYQYPKGKIVAVKKGRGFEPRFRIEDLVLFGFLYLTMLAFPYANLPTYVYVLFVIAFGITIKIKGNTWRGKLLERMGYEHKVTIPAKNAAIAKAQYIKSL